MTNLHRLPEPVPEGWAKSGQWADRISYRRGPLLVANFGDKWAAYPPASDHDSLPEACAAAERAFCGCYVGRSAPVKRESAP